MRSDTSNNAIRPHHRALEEAAQVGGPYLCPKSSNSHHTAPLGKPLRSKEPKDDETCGHLSGSP